MNARSPGRPGGFNPNLPIPQDPFVRPETAPIRLPPSVFVPTPPTFVPVGTAPMGAPQAGAPSAAGSASPALASYASLLLWTAPAWLALAWRFSR
jgi:hypothetical protein